MFLNNEGLTQRYHEAHAQDTAEQSYEEKCHDTWEISFSLLCP